MEKKGKVVLIERKTKPLAPLEWYNVEIELDDGSKVRFTLEEASRRNYDDGWARTVFNGRRHGNVEVFGPLADQLVKRTEG